LGVSGLDVVTQRAGKIGMIRRRELCKEVEAISDGLTTQGVLLGGV
jgi:hypothetical protein